MEAPLLSEAPLLTSRNATPGKYGFSFQCLPPVGGVLFTAHLPFPWSTQRLGGRSAPLLSRQEEPAPRPLNLPWAPSVLAELPSLGPTLNGEPLRAEGEEKLLGLCLTCTSLCVPLRV